MPTHPTVWRGRRRTAVSRRVLLPVVALLVMWGGCQEQSLQKKGQRCGDAFGACAKGLRCSYKKKRCYRPVNCGLLERRMKACLTEVVSTYAPGLKKLDAQKRARLLERIGHHLKTEVVDHCRYDAAAYQKKHGSAPTQTKSFGEDPKATQIAACLREQGCRPFASCLLGVARVVGKKRPSPKAPPVFPIERPRPTPTVQPDAGAPATGTDAMTPADAMKIKGTKKAPMPVARPMGKATPPRKRPTPPPVPSRR